MTDGPNVRPSHSRSGVGGKCGGKCAGNEAGLGTFGLVVIGRLAEARQGKSR